MAGAVDLKEKGEMCPRWGSLVCLTQIPAQPFSVTLCAQGASQDSSALWLPLELSPWVSLAGGARKVREHFLPLSGVPSPNWLYEGSQNRSTRTVFFWLSLSLGWYLPVCYSQGAVFSPVVSWHSAHLSSSIKPSLNYPSLSVPAC